jgi:hypothetical protein
MTNAELKELFKGNKKSDSKKITAAALTNIAKFVMPNLCMDDKTLDYYYEVGIDELLESDMPLAEYEVMKEQGWKIKGNNLVIYLT